jgi:hypothetical protein
MSQNAALGEIGGPLPKTTPTVYGLPSLPISGDAVSPALSKKPLPFILIGGIAGLLLAIGPLAGWRLFHRNVQSTPIQIVRARPVQPPAPVAEVALPAAELVDPPSPVPALSDVKPQAPAPARKPRRMKAATAANPAPPAPAADPKTAQLVSLQSLALGTHAVEMVPDLCPSIFMDAYHRSMRRSLPAGHPQPNLLEATDMIAGDAYTSQLVEPGGRLDRLLQNGSSDEQVIDDFYLAALARPPQPEEKQALLSYTQRHQANRKAALANIEWAVISSREFAYNH